MSGILYGVGVGPGDPELMTRKAIRLIRECDMVAAPGKRPQESMAYRIAAQSVPEIAEKEILQLDMPMTTDDAALRAAHDQSAARIRAALDAGKNIAYLTIGDPTIYCTFSYLRRLLVADGYRAEFVNGVPSFCAAAARLGVSLAEWEEPLHVIPAVHRLDDGLDFPGTCVLMKSASRLGEARKALLESGRDVYAASDCGLPGERLYYGAEEIPEDAGYFTLIIAKEEKE